MDTLFFIASKVLSFAEQPLSYVLVLLFAGMIAILSNRSLTAVKLNLAATLLLVLIGIKFIPDLIVRTLEDSYADRPSDIENFRGLVVLGGAIEGGLVTIERKDTVLNEAAERVTTALELARRYPHLQVLYTGSSARMMPEGVSGAEAAMDFFVRQSLTQARLVLQPRSRNTYEDALMAARLPGVDVEDRWLLVTSAVHMPRALRSFRKQGWNVTPYATDFRTGASVDAFDYSIVGGAIQWALALHELFVLVAYRATGKI